MCHPREIRGGAPAEFRILINQRNLTGKAADVRLYRRKVIARVPTEPVITKSLLLKVLCFIWGKIIVLHDDNNG